MGLLNDVAAPLTFGTSELAPGGRLDLFNRGHGGQSAYGGLPFENPNNQVDSSQVAAALQKGLGRPPTPQEIDQYSKYVKSGDLSYGEIGQIAAGLPEAQKARLDQYAGQFGDTLNAQNGAILNQAASAANSQFANLGRNTTSAQGASVMQAGSQLAQQRQSALASFYGQGLGNNLNAYGQQGQDAQNRAYSLGDQRTAFNRSLLGYQTQRNDFNTDLNNQNAYNRQRALGQFAGGLVGAGIGGYYGGEKGAETGSKVGALGGGLF